MSMLLLEAMARMEGFGKPGTRPTRNNNPLDIEWGQFAKAHGATGPEQLPLGSPSRFAVFPNVAAGWDCAAALVTTVNTKYHGLTITTLIRGQRDDAGNLLPGGYSGWAPPIENNDTAYIDDVLLWTGLQANDPVAEHLQVPGQTS
jgi:hypothetical protein